MPIWPFRKKKSTWIKFLLENLLSIIIGILIVFVFFPIVIFLILRPTVQKDINYGTTFSNKYAEELGLDWQDAYIKILDDLNVKNLRLIAYWDEVEPERDQYDFSNIKWQLDEAKKRDAQVILAIGRKQPRWPECFAPMWWNEIDSREARQLELYEYMKESVTTLQGYDNIIMWQVENEPFFPFGDCQKDIRREEVLTEVEIVKHLDERPIILQDSGEGGFWFMSYQIGDKLGISMYRRIWYDFWGVFLGRFIYFQYPLAHWTYKIKAGLMGVPYENVYVTELQSEPWGPGINSSLSSMEKDKTMSRDKFLATINYAQKSGFKNLYFWGVEWWLWEKEMNNNPYFWNTAKAIIN